jgi:triphosphoribosyl-dephospho-CoA synthase
VDIRNSGAHRDMDLAAFERSTAAIAPWMEKFFIMGHSTAKLDPQTVMVMLRRQDWPVRTICYRRRVA